MQLEYGNISENDWLYALGRRADAYRQYADEVLTLSYLTEEERAELHEEYIKKAEDLDLEYFNNWKKLEQERTEKEQERSASYISDRTFYNDWQQMGDDPIAAFNRVRAQRIADLIEGIITPEEYADYMTDLGNTMYDERRADSESWLQQQRKYGNISVEEYIAGLERQKTYTEEYYRNGLIDHRTYVENMQELNDAIFDEEKAQLDDLINEHYDAQQQMLDDRREAIEKAYAEEEKAEQKADREAELADLLEQERIFEGAVTIEGKKKLEDIRNQIEAIEDEQRQEQRDAEKQAQLDALDEEEERLENARESALEGTSKFTAEMVGLIDGGNKDLSASFSDLLSNQSQQQQQILEEGYQNVVKMVNQINSKMQELVLSPEVGIYPNVTGATGNNSYSVNQQVTTYVNDATMGNILASSLERAAWSAMYLGGLK